MDFRQISACLPAWLAADLVGYEERCQALVDAGNGEATDIGDRVEIAGPAERKAAGSTDCRQYRGTAADPSTGLTPRGASEHETAPARRRAPVRPGLNFVVIDGCAAQTAAKGRPHGPAAHLSIVARKGERAHSAAALP